MRDSLMAEFGVKLIGKTGKMVMQIQAHGKREKGRFFLRRTYFSFRLCP